MCWISLLAILLLPSATESLKAVPTCAFLPQSIHRFAGARSAKSLTKIGAARVAIADEATASLHFAGSTTYTTRSAPLPRKEKPLGDFFAADEYRDCLCCGSGNVLAEPCTTAGPDLMARWSKEAARTHAAQPTANDKIIQLTLSTDFLVFTMTAVAMIGCKLLQPPKENPLRSPEYQFTLIREEFGADGPPPLLWIFNQLTGAGRAKKEDSGQYNHAFFRVKAVPTDGGQRVAFQGSLTTEINIRFASALLSILPVAKEIIEEHGCSALKKNMRRDVPPGMDKFRSAYVDWLLS